MPTKARTHNPLPPATRKAIANANAKQERAADQRHRMYKMLEWRDLRVGLRAMQIAIEPTCRECAKAGVVTAATEVDHIVPHRGDMRVFLDAGNLQSLCKSCHASKTSKEWRDREPERWAEIQAMGRETSVRSGHMARIQKVAAEKRTQRAIERYGVSSKEELSRAWYEANREREIAKSRANRLRHKEKNQ